MKMDTLKTPMCVVTIGDGGFTCSISTKHMTFDNSSFIKFVKWAIFVNVFISQWM